MKKVIVLFLLWWVIVNLFGLFALNRFNLKSDNAYIWINPTEFFQEQKWDLISLHAHWDSFWYLDIAKNGYSFKGPEKLSNIVFFPLYPILMRSLAILFCNNLILTGWVLSSLFLLLSLFYFFKLVKEFHSEINPYLTIVLLLIFPTSFFLNAIYTESLFLFLSLAAFYYALKKRFLLANVFGFFASLTRISGAILFIPLFWEYLKTIDFKFPRLFNFKTLSFSLTPLGTLIFFFYHYLRFHDFFLFFKVESWWGRAFKFNKDHFLIFSNPAIVNLCLDVFFIIFAFIVLYFVFKKFPTSYALYMLFTLIIILSTGTLMSVGRYILVLFPIYIFLASVKNQYFLFGWMLASTLLLSMYITLFVNNYWAG
jgi:Gpi18-like mannosyltransferase